MSVNENMHQSNGEEIPQSETSDSQINDLIRNLSVPSNIVVEATKLLNQFRGHKPDSPDTEPSSDDTLWFACFLYIASIEERCLPYGAADPQIALGNLPPASITVSDLLSAVHVNMLQFFKLLRTIKEVSPLSAKVQDSITQLNRKYLIVCPLFNKFDKIFAEIFLKDDNFKQADMLFNSDSEGYEFRRNFCWTLFVYAKASILRGTQQLVLTFHLLIACVEYVLRTTPAFQLRPPFDGLKMESSDMESTVVLEELCSKYCAAAEEVIALQDNLLNPLLKTLTEDGNTVSCEDLQRTYLERYQQFGDINELGFLANERHLVVKTSNTVVSNGSGGGGGGGFGGGAQGGITSSPVVMGPPMTPIRTAMVTVQSLRKLLDTADDHPAPALVQYFQNCAATPQPAIDSMLAALRDTFCRQLCVRGGMPETVAHQRYQLATRLYYRVLESLLKLEEKRLSLQDFSKLLHNIVFHRCLLGCAVEVVVMTYASSWTPSPPSPSIASGGGGGGDNQDLRFPWILSAFELHAYDFVKVLESFVKAEPRLAGDVVKHLQHIENRIVESMAWQANSPLFASLAASEPPPFSPADSPGGSGLFCPGAHLYLSPMPPPRPGHSPAGLVRNSALLPPLSPANHNSSLIPPSSPRQQGGHHQGVRMSQSLNLFFNKVCKLAHLRLQNMSTLLDIPRDLQHRIWMCIEFCISQKTELLRDRHLDQIIMCSVFAVCKISDLDVKFKTIVNMYKNLPHARREVYKNVTVSPGTCESIIGFYNVLFMHSLKNFLMQFTSARPNNLSLSPVPRTQNLPASPIYPLPGRTNFYVSQLRQSPSQFRLPMSPSQMTPRTRRLYSFGESIGSGDKLKTINDSMKAITNMPGAGHRAKRLKFDTDAVVSAAADNDVSGDVAGGKSAEGASVDRIVVKRVSSATSTVSTASSAPGSAIRKSLNFNQAENTESLPKD